MKTAWKWLVAISVVLCSITCVMMEPLPTTEPPAPGKLSETGNTEPSPDELDQSVVERLNRMLANDFEMGGVYRIDSDQDGQNDRVYIEFPIQHLTEWVTASSSLVYTQKTDPDYAKGFYIILSNQQNTGVEFTYSFRIPLEFDQSPAAYNFDPQPDRVIEDREGLRLVFEIELGQAYRKDNLALVVYNPSIQSTGKRQSTGSQRHLVIEILRSSAFSSLDDAEINAMRDALPEEKRRCDALPEPQRGNCFADISEDFRLILSSGDKVDLCSKVSDLLRQKACLAVVKAQLASCDTQELSFEEIQLCKAYFAIDSCELKIGSPITCLYNMAVENNITLACQTLEDRDMRNDCLAQVSRDGKYCEEIINSERRADCLKKYSKVLPSEDKPQPGQNNDPLAEEKGEGEESQSGPPTPVDIDGIKLRAEFAAQVNEKVVDCNKRNCEPPPPYPGCALDCRGVGTFFFNALYNDYFLHIHSDYKPRADFIATFLLTNLQACNDRYIASKDRDRTPVYHECVGKFNEQAMTMLEDAWDNTCQVWCSEQGKSGFADGVPRTCVCE